MSTRNVPAVTRGPAGIIVDDSCVSDISHAAMGAAAVSVSAVQPLPSHAVPRTGAGTEPSALDRLVDLPTILRRIPVARSTLFQRIREGKFPQGRRFGRRRLWREQEVNDFVNDLWKDCGTSPPA